MATIQLKLLFVAAVGFAAACSTGADPRGSTTPVLTQAPLPGACALGVPEALVSVDETTDGVAFTFLGPPSRVSELRQRVQHAAELHGPEGHRGLGHDGRHGLGGHHGLQAMQLPPSRASVTPVEAGARLTLIPVTATDKEALVQKARDAAQRINHAACN